MFLVFLEVFRVFRGCSWFSGVSECSVMFRCSGVPVFLEVLHAVERRVLVQEVIRARLDTCLRLSTIDEVVSRHCKLRNRKTAE